MKSLKGVELLHTLERLYIHTSHQKSSIDSFNKMLEQKTQVFIASSFLASTFAFKRGVFVGLKRFFLLNDYPRQRDRALGSFLVQLRSHPRSMAAIEESEKFVPRRHAFVFSYKGSG